MDVEGIREFAGPSVPSWATGGPRAHRRSRRQGRHGALVVYAVAALGLLRRSDAVPGLLAAFRKIGAPAPETAAARGVVIYALTTVLTGSERTWSRSAGPAPERSWVPLLLKLAADPDDQLAGMSVGLLARLRDPAHHPVFLAVVGDAAVCPR